MTDGTKLDIIIEAVKPFADGNTPGKMMDAIENLMGRPLKRSERYYIVDEMEIFRLDRLTSA